MKPKILLEGKKITVKSYNNVLWLKPKPMKFAVPNVAEFILGVSLICLLCNQKKTHRLKKNHISGSGNIRIPRKTQLGTVWLVL